MADSTKGARADAGQSQIVGFRISKELAAEVKAEADRRGIRLNLLFEELWQLYRASNQPGKS